MLAGSRLMRGGVVYLLAVLWTIGVIARADDAGNPAIPRLFLHGKGETNLVFRFKSQPQKKYRLSVSRDLTQWSGWGEVLTGTGDDYLFFYDLDEDEKAFFAIEENSEFLLNSSMVWIPPGSFVMGSPSTELGREGDEAPQTQVTISRGFWMGRYEVTQREYREVTGTNPSQFRGNERPVERVTWQEAISYCNQLTFRERAAGRLPEGYAYRLPTEAEFEYACRAGTTTRYSFGDGLNTNELSRFFWYGDNGRQTSHNVGKKFPNPWGLHDMHGNVWEWCLDWYGNRYPGGAVTDPRGAASSAGRVIRGGGWDYDAASCRSAFRNFCDPKRKLNYIGFRVVLGPAFAP